MKYLSVKLLIMVVTVLFVSSQYFYSQEATKKNMLILMLENKSDKKKYSTSEALQPMIFQSLYNFVSVIPTFEMPNSTTMKSIKWTEFDLSTIAKEHSVDFVICGEYKYKSVKNSLIVKIELRVWSMEAGAILMEKSYQAPPDMDIFDAIDAMINDIIKSITHSDFAIGHIKFSDFKVGNTQYAISINNKQTAIVSNEQFLYTYAVLAGTGCDVAIKTIPVEDEETKTVYQQVHSPKGGEKVLISYQAKGQITIAENKAENPNKDFRLLLNGQIVNENQILQGMPANMDYLFEVTHSNNVYYIATNYLGDGDVIAFDFDLKDEAPIEVKSEISKATALVMSKSTNTVSVSTKKQKNITIVSAKEIAFKIGFLGEGLFYISFQGARTPKWWLNFDMGGLNPLFTIHGNFTSVFDAFMGFGGGYYVLGGFHNDWRLGVGLNIRAYLDLAGQDGEVYENPIKQGQVGGSAGIVLTGEWRFIFVQTGIYFNSGGNGVDGNISIPISIGLRM